MPDIASSSSIPIGGLATCNRTRCPAIVISPPIGTRPKVMIAGTSTRNGANLKTVRSASEGIRSSFRINLSPSARVWSRPNGPQRWGPIRLCMSEIALRSNQIITITEVIKSPRPKRHFARTITTMARPTWPLFVNNGSTVASQLTCSPIEPGRSRRPHRRSGARRPRRRRRASRRRSR